MQSAEATVRAEERKRKEKKRNTQIKSCFCRSQFFIGLLVPPPGTSSQSFFYPGPKLVYTDCCGGGTWVEKEEVIEGTPNRHKTPNTHLSLRSICVPPPR